MSENLTELSDADLDAMIYDNPSEHDGDSGEASESVSPANEEAEEQPTDTEDGTDVDQPEAVEEDSDEESTDEDQTDDSEDDTSTEEDESEEDDTESSEDKDTETGKTSSKSTEKYQPLKANGKEYPIDSIDELYKLASAGVGAQQKYQAIAGHVKEIKAAQKAKVDMMEAVNMMADYQEDPKRAILRMLKDNGIDPLDLDTDGDVAKMQDRSISDFEVSYDEVVGEIGDSPIFPKVQNLLLNGWDKASRDIFLDKPEMIRNLHDEMTPLDGQDKSLFDLVSPIAEKMKLSGDRRPDYDIYMDARAKKIQEIQKHENAKSSVKPKAKVDVKKKKKAASPTGGNSTNSKALDFSAMSDAELDAFLEKA